MIPRGKRLRFANLIAVVFTVLLVLDLGYGVPWLVRAPIAFLAGVGFLELWEWSARQWHERARRKRLTPPASEG